MVVFHKMQPIFYHKLIMYMCCSITFIRVIETTTHQSSLLSVDCMILKYFRI